MATSAWSNARISTCNPGADPACSRCGAICGDDFHTFWCCPANESIGTPGVVNTQGLMALAKEQVAELPCLWLRGILPSTLTDIKSEHLPPDDIKITFINPNAITLGGGSYYGDASGGFYTSFPLLRRCGISAILADAEGNMIWGAKFNLPGQVQTVPRAELFAVVFVLELVEAGSTVIFTTDSYKNCESYHKGPMHTQYSLNADLFRRMFTAINVKGIHFTLRWMPSHLNDGKKTIPDHVTCTDIRANSIADEFAGEAAKTFKVPLNVSAPIIYYHNLTKRIQFRLIDILCHLPHRAKVHSIKLPKIPKPKLEDIIGNSTHVAFVSQGLVCCARCRQSFPKTGELCKRWLATTCPDIGQTTDQPIPIPHYQIHIARGLTHHSHRMHMYRGLYFCNRCGAIGEKRLNKLARQCETPTEAGSRNIRYIKNNKLPVGVPRWPIDHDRFPFGEPPIADHSQGSLLSTASASGVQILHTVHEP